MSLAVSAPPLRAPAVGLALRVEAGDAAGGVDPFEDDVAWDALRVADLLEQKRGVARKKAVERVGRGLRGRAHGLVGDKADDAAGGVLDDEQRFGLEAFAFGAQDGGPRLAHKALDLH